MNQQVIENVFSLVVERLKNEILSLHQIRKFKGGGIEGWLKVEVVLKT